MRHGADAGVAFVAAGNGVDGVEHGDVGDGHGPAGPAGAELLAEDPGFARGHRGMVQAAGVDADLVPVPDPGGEAGGDVAQPAGRRPGLAVRLVSRPQGFVQTLEAAMGPGGGAVRSRGAVRVLRGRDGQARRTEDQGHGQCENGEEVFPPAAGNRGLPGSQGCSVRIVHGLPPFGEQDCNAVHEYFPTGNENSSRNPWMSYVNRCERRGECRCIAEVMPKLLQRSDDFQSETGLNRTISEMNHLARDILATRAKGFRERDGGPGEGEIPFAQWGFPFPRPSAAIDVAALIL